MNALKKVKGRFSIKDKHDRERTAFFSKPDSILSCRRLVFSLSLPAPIRTYRASPLARPHLGSICQPSASLKKLAQIANTFFPADYSADEADEETNEHLQKEIE